jgi:hypothetical protein
MNKSFQMNAVRIAGYAGGLLLLLGTATGAYANTGTININSISPGNSIPVGTKVTFTVTATGFNSPKYVLSDGYHNGSLGGYDLDSLGQFAWTPVQNDVGTHPLAIVVSDSSGNAATANYTLTVTPSGTSISSSGSNPVSTSPVSLSLSAVSPSSNVNAGQTVTVSAVASGFPGAPNYTVFDSSEASSITNSNISSNGVFSWTPQTHDAGTHLINITAADTAGRIATSSVVIAVQTAAGTTGTTATQTTAADPTFTTDLALGSNDPQVMMLQQVLIAQGDLTATANGHFGDATKAAVIKFQAAHKIAQLGNVGPTTRAALNALVGTVSTPTQTTSTTNSATKAQIQTEFLSILSAIQLIESQISSL